MIGDSTLLQVRVNDHKTNTLMNTRCDAYILVSEDFARRLSLPYVERKPRNFGGFTDSSPNSRSAGVAVMALEIGRHEQLLYAYVIKDLSKDLFLEKP